MKKILFPLVLLICGINTIWGQVVLRGKVSNVNPSAPKIVMADYWAIDHWQQLAILPLDSENQFNINVKPVAQAQCRIRMAGQRNVVGEFVLPAMNEKKDTVLVFDFDAKTANGSPLRFPNSPENDLYYELITEFNHLNKIRDSLKTTAPDQVKAAELKFNKFCADMSARHPGTYTGDVVANLLYTPDKSDYTKDPASMAMTEGTFRITHMLDKVPFRYDGALYHSAFFTALERYFNIFDMKVAGASKVFIDKVMAYRNGSEAIDVYLFKYMLDKMLDFKDEAGLQHLLTWYLPDCSDASPLTDYTKTLIHALQSCEPGKTIPALQMPGLNGMSVNLDDVCSKNKMTLLYFWRKGCSHCKELKPVLMELYDKYHPQGLEIFSILMDNSELGLQEAMAQEPTKWVNVYVPSERRKEINQLFPVPSTPTLISLDSSRKVMSRLIYRRQLEAYLQEALK